uniref:Protein kinase domain-containing protein n=1 Tax=viral metagenome TaxID=1070528 RepID=A0A6C0E390_9ZZZZ
MKIERMDSLGCIIHPVYIKKSKPNSPVSSNKKYISRMVKQDFFLHNEIVLYQVISNYTSSFYIFEIAEKITYHKLNTEQYDLSSFTKSLDKSEFYLLKYPKRTLYSFKELCNASNYINKSHYIRFLINTYRKLLESIDLLLKNNIVHNQICYDTVCIDNHDDALITRFGLSMYTIPSNINHEYIHPFFTTYDPAYPYWPIEFHVLSYLLTNKMETISSLHIDQVVEETISKNKLFARLSSMNNDDGEQYKIQAKQTTMYLNKYINQPLKYIIEDVFCYKHTWDQYALSALFLGILLELQEQERNFIKNQFFISFVQLLECNIYMVPSKRMSLKHTLECFHKLICETDINIFREFMDLMNV